MPEPTVDTSASADASRSPGPRVHAETPDACILRLEADTSNGLTLEEAARRLARDGPNELPKPKGPNRLKQFFAQFTNPIVLTLLVAAVIAIIDGASRVNVSMLERYGDATAILLIVALNAVLGYYQEVRAEAALEALQKMQVPNARVRRGDQVMVVAATELVVGDLLEIEAGDAVPADARLLQTINLAAEEAALTGESMPAGKDAAAAVDDDAPMGDRTNMLFVGTSVVRGKGRAIVSSTGGRTELGKLSALISQSRDRTTPLEDRLAHFGKRILWACLALSVLLFARGMVKGDRSWHELLLEAVSLAVAAIPEGLPAITTITLALGMQRMAKRGAIIRKLAAVETLGAATVICTDKTGTLTQGHLAVSSLASVDGDTLLLDDAVLACEPDPYDPLDRAIVEYARCAGTDVDTLHSGALVADWPFDPNDKYITHVWRLADGSYRVVAKGSIEGVARHAGGALGAAAQAAHDRFAEQGMRVIAVAAGPSVGPSGDRAEDESNLEYAGLVAFSDPVREGVAEALEQCRTAGIRVIMITGDHPATAHAVAEGLRLPHEGQDGDHIATGDDLDAASDAEFDALAATVNVFARTRPEHKHRLVVALRRQGEVVAMTGDGTNDAPALRAADIGVAMGKRGTEVAREAATIVLLDDNFATIVTAVRNGRRIYDNLARAFGYLVAFHAPLLITALVVPLVGKPLLLLPIQLILLELLLHPVVSLVFQADAADPDVMTRDPLPASSGLGWKALWRPYAVGIVLALGILGLYLGALSRGWTTEQARGLGFATLLGSQAFLVIVERSPHMPVWRAGLRPTRELIGALVVIVAVTIASVYLAPFARLLQMAPFPVGGWIAALVVSVVSTLWSEPLK